MILETNKGALSFAAKTPDPWNAYSALAVDSFAGQNVTPEGSLSLAAVYGAVSMVSSTCGTMPLQTIDTRATGGSRVVRGGWMAPMLEHQPNADMSGVDLWTLVFAHLLLRGNAYLAKIKDKRGVVSELYPLNPAFVHPFRDENGDKVFRVRKYGPTGFVDTNFTSEVILHIKGQSFDDGVTGASPIEVLRNRLGVHLAQSEYQGRQYQDGMLIKGVLSTPQNNLSPEAATMIKQQWKSAYSGVGAAHDIAVLHSGVQFQNVSLSPEDAQFIQSMRWGHTEVATAFQIPASRLNGEGTSLTYANQGQDDLFYYKQACFPRIRFVESALNMDKDLFGFNSPWIPKFNPDAMLRADIETRFRVYATARGIGVLSVNDVREYEDLPGVSGGDDYTPLSTTKGDTVASGGAVQQRAVEQRYRQDGEGLRANGFDITIPSIEVKVPNQPAPIVNVHVPEQVAPVVNVTVPESETVVNVAAPDVQVDVAAPEVNVTVPEVQVDVAAPVVNISPPNVTVDPTVIVEQPASTGVEFVRDAQGRITAAKVVE